LNQNKSKVNIDEVTVKFLNIKIERMHKEIEFAVDRANEMTARVNDAIKILDEEPQKVYTVGGEWAEDNTESINDKLDKLRLCLVPNQIKPEEKKQ
jgi:hypothetical protein